jgi:hypothetical protein
MHSSDFSELLELRMKEAEEFSSSEDEEEEEEGESSDEEEVFSTGGGGGGAAGGRCYGHPYLRRGSFRRGGGAQRGRL